MNEKLLFILTVILGAGFVGNAVATPPDAVSEREEKKKLKKEIKKYMIESSDFGLYPDPNFSQEEKVIARDFLRILINKLIGKLENEDDLEILRISAADLEKQIAGRRK